MTDLKNISAGSDINFEELYLKVRQKEGRIYGPETIKSLPEITFLDKHYAEWLLRKESFEYFLQYQKNRDREVNILELGCGNGWFSARLAGELPDSKVVGCDLNKTELNLAEVTFDLPNLTFLYSDVFKGLPDEHTPFDVVILASSAQYFPDLQQLISVLWDMSAAEAEIHIIDSGFYRKESLPKALKRTENYYKKLGFPEMTNNYFHHSYQDLKDFKYDFLYRPASGLRKLISKRKSPFPWIRIKK